jgi:hypothetical protein
MTYKTQQMLRNGETLTFLGNLIESYGMTRSEGWDCFIRHSTNLDEFPNTWNAVIIRYSNSVAVVQNLNAENPHGLINRLRIRRAVRKALRKA